MASSSSSVALYIGVLVVLGLVNLMSESFVEGRSLHLDEGISMVTEALPQQQYFSLPAERFTEFLGNTPSVVSFASFVTKYQKVYKSLGEIKHRFATFLENLELIEATNKKKLSYTLGINEFADLTFDEMRSMYLMNGEQNCSATKGNHVLTDVELPKEKDWRPEGIVSLVKNQAHCGSCWTFRFGYLTFKFSYIFGEPRQSSSKNQEVKGLINSCKASKTCCLCSDLCPSGAVKIPTSTLYFQNGI
jgi:hypothetical protein